MQHGSLGRAPGCAAVGACKWLPVESEGDLQGSRVRSHGGAELGSRKWMPVALVQRTADWGRGYAADSVSPCGCPRLFRGRTDRHGHVQWQRRHEGGGRAGKLIPLALRHPLGCLGLSADDVKAADAAFEARLRRMPRSYQLCLGNAHALLTRRKLERVRDFPKPAACIGGRDACARVAGVG
jgi:hypothetical protein